MRTLLDLEDLASQAVKAALAQQWQQAVDLNLELLADSPQNIEATNRLARSYQELGDIETAKATYAKVLGLDPYNPIAQKNLDKLERGTHTSGAFASSSQELFLEEPGKTRIAKIAQPQLDLLSKILAGEQVLLEDQQGLLALKSMDGQLLGHLEDDLGLHVTNLIHLGNSYTAHVMNVTGDPQVFLRETSQSERAAKFISFSRSHVPSQHGSSTMKDALATEDPLHMDPSIMEESGDDWESDTAHEPRDLDDGDDFTSVSLDAMREEEDDTTYRAMRDEY
jgi:tetratricopeptide (TPR) repeat protein